MTKEKVCKNKRRLLKVIGLCFLIVAVCIIFVLWYAYYSSNSQAYKENERIIKEYVKNSSGSLYPDPVINYDEVTRVSIARADVTDLRPLEQFNNLTFLELGYYLPGSSLRVDNSLYARVRKYLGLKNPLKPPDPIDLNTLKNLSNLKELRIHRQNVTNINGLSYLKNLKSLNLSDTNIKSLSPLKDLKNLKILKISDGESNIKDCSSLKNLVKLEVLDINCSINMKNIKDIVNLKLLDITGTDINNFEYIGNLTNLEYLNLGHINFSTLNALSNLRKLKALNIGFYKVNEPVDFQPLAQLVNLENLKLSSMDKPVYIDIQPLLKLLNLKSLTIYKINISDEEISELQQALPELKIIK